MSKMTSTAMISAMSFNPGPGGLSHMFQASPHTHGYISKHAHTKESAFQVTENRAFGILQPVRRYSQTMFPMLHLDREKLSFLETMVQKYTFISVCRITGKRFSVMIEEKQNGCLQCFADKLSMRMQATNRRIQHPYSMQMLNVR